MTAPAAAPGGDARADVRQQIARAVRKITGEALIDFSVADAVLAVPAVADALDLKQRIEALADELKMPSEPVGTAEWEDGYDSAREDGARRLRNLLDAS